MLNSLLSLFSIVLFAYFLYAVLKINASLAPIISLTSLVSLITVLSMVNLLFIGVILAHFLAFGTFVYAVIKNKSEILLSIKQFFTAGVALFIFSSVCMLIVLNINTPLLIGWDEFSFWGTSQKLVHTNNALYTYYNSSMVGTTTPPTLAVLSYFFQSFNNTYTEHISFFAYDVMFFAAFASFTAVFKNKKTYLCILLFVMGFLLPYFFSVYTNTISLVSVYVDTYADIPLGIMFAACLAIYFFQQSYNKKFLCILPALFFLTLIKDMGFALCCIVIFIIFMHLLFNKKQFKFLVFNNFVAKLIYIVLLFLCSVAAFVSWAIHMGAVMQVNRFNLGGQNNMGMATMLITGVVELFSPIKSEKFLTISNYMLSALFTANISMIGSGAIILALITAIFVASFILANKKGKILSLTVYFSALIGFVGYYVFHIFLYVYIFKDNGYYLPSYNRYISTYYIGFLMLAIFVLCLNIVENEKFKIANSAIFCTVFLLVLVNFINLVKIPHTFAGANESFYSIRHEVNQKTEYLGDSVKNGDVIYFDTGVEDYGNRWFIFAYEYVQNIFVLDMTMPVQDTLSKEEYNNLVREQLIQYFKSNDVTHMMLDSNSELANDYFNEDFENTIYKETQWEIAYFKVEYIGENDIEFELIKGDKIEDG